MTVKGTAQAALVFGLISLVLGWIPIFGWIICITAFFLGIGTLRSLHDKKSEEGRAYRTYAWVGIICGGIPLLVWIFIGIFFVSIMSAVFSLLPSALPLIPDMCSVDNNFLCTGAMASDEGLLLSLINNKAENITSVIVSAGGQCAPRDVAWNAGEEIAFTCPSSSAQQRVITITYKVAGDERYRSTDGFVRAQ